MVNYFEPTQEQINEYDEWVQSRPECVRVIAERFKPWKLYSLGPKGHRVLVTEFSEGGTVVVDVRGEFNFLAFERRVFGVDPDSLEECGLPAEGELIGAAIRTMRNNC